ncbi:MAG: ABC transporter substrate-binding protein [Polyangia bacterium]
MRKQPRLRKTLLSLSLGGGLALWLGAAALGGAGCSLSQNFNECNADTDCGPGPSGEKLYCSEGLCAIGTPKAKLCTETFPSPAPANAIPIGALVNISSGNDGQTTLAMKLAIEEMNKARIGDGDRPMVLHICDYGKVAGDALKSMQILARERGVIAVIGPTSSANVLAVADEVRRSGIPLMSPSATSPLISDLQPPGLFFRVVPSDAKQGPLLSKQISPTTARYAMLYVDDAYGSGLKDAFFKSFPANTPVATVAYSEKTGDQAQLQAKLQQILTAGTLDYLVAITNEFSDSVVTGLKPLGSTTKILMADGAKNENVLALASTADMATKTHLARISGTAPTVEGSNGLYSAFLSAFAGRFQQNAASSIYNAFSYDAAYAIGIALAGAGNDATPARIVEMLLRINGGAKMMSVGGTQYLNAKRAIQAGAGLTLSGTTGGIGFDTHGDRLSALFEKWTINTTVTPPRFDSTPLQ